LHQNKLNLAVFILLALASFLLGISSLLSEPSKSLSNMLTFFNLHHLLTANTAKWIIGSLFIALAASAMIAVVKARFIRYTGMFSMVIGTIAVLTLFDASRWIESLGGFPAIGSGQGIIKYFSLIALGMTLLLLQANKEKLVLALNIFPLALVLLWIGGMKFTLIEAKGIEPLITSSPFMSWMYQLGSVQGVSNIIGIYDLIAMGALIIGFWYRKALVVGVLLTLAVMLTTQTYLFTWPAALSSESLLTSGGQFLIKDLWYIANLLFILNYLKNAQASDIN